MRNRAIGRWLSTTLVFLAVVDVAGGVPLPPKKRVDAQTAIPARFLLLVGFPAPADDDRPRSIVVPGAVIPIDEPADVERGISLGQAIDKLWTTFRLDPARRLQSGMSALLALRKPVEVPAPEGTGITATVTLAEVGDQGSSYAVALRQGAKVLADSTVKVRRGGRAVVGGTDGDAAPYVFLVLEPEVAGANRPIRLDEDLSIEAPVAVKKVNPPYPEECRKERIQGIVIVDAVVEVDGRVSDVVVLRAADPRLGRAATEAVRQWTFRPARRSNGTPVRVRFFVTLNFRLA